MKNVELPDPASWALFADDESLAITGVVVGALLICTGEAADAGYQAPFLAVTLVVAPEAPSRGQGKGQA
ncbi:hypothetical protein [Streptomyces sp. NPDC056387]|uniref:hypothetical protein n=1 Tax=Streptomyces sp. NPDC056387 TaxID=3345803 RepID=UPI0035E342AA